MSIKIFFTPSLNLLREEKLNVGDNQPYSSKGSFGYTLALHGKHNHIPAISMEYRQDYLQNQQQLDYYYQLTMKLCTFLQDKAVKPANVNHFTPYIHFD